MPSPKLRVFSTSRFYQWDPPHHPEKTQTKSSPLSITSEFCEKSLIGIPKQTEVTEQNHFLGSQWPLTEQPQKHQSLLGNKANLSSGDAMSWARGEWEERKLKRAVWALLKMPQSRGAGKLCSCEFSWYFVLCKNIKSGWNISDEAYRISNILINIKILLIIVFLLIKYLREKHIFSLLFQTWPTYWSSLFY